MSDRLELSVQIGVSKWLSLHTVSQQACFREDYSEWEGIRVVERATTEDRDCPLSLLAALLGNILIESFYPGGY